MNQSGTGEKALYVFLGAFIGAATALLLAPRSGEETRRLIASKAREGSDFVAAGTKNVADRTTSYIDSGKEILQAQGDKLAAAIEAGKQAYQGKTG